VRPGTACAIAAQSGIEATSTRTPGSLVVSVVNAASTAAWKAAREPVLPGGDVAGAEIGAARLTSTYVVPAGTAAACATMPSGR
jgi:hypothetical protein